MPTALIVRTCGSEPAVYSVDEFIDSRITLLLAGELTDFREWELAGHTDLFGDIAQQFCSYAKSWAHDGTPATGRGMQTFQFVRIETAWRNERGRLGRRA